MIYNYKVLKRNSKDNGQVELNKVKGEKTISQKLDELVDLVHKVIKLNNLKTK
ncbi:MAG: hypothetical protein LBJ97_02825 [Mycoplasmataceae bacterium]|jgi:hypothetical protein|nr:hypothetical protein [Mycoplasmataceae bacterium]